jgi:lipopolysaccharide/colanic/teichoic acid biosynthesis glycosyltransferase
MGNDQSVFIVEKVKKVNKNPLYLFLKRVMDILLALIAILVFGIPMLIIAILIKRDKGPVFFKQYRLGLNEKPFLLIKFRSMVVDAEKNGQKWAEKDDPRVTKIGKVLRKHRLDELPQVFNILLGHMSVVGPRPEVKKFYEEFETYIKGFKQRLLVKPGLTGWAQINGGYDLKPEEKIVFDVQYINKQNIFFDIFIVLKTIIVVITKDGAH